VLQEELGLTKFHSAGVNTLSIGIEWQPGHLTTAISASVAIRQVMKFQEYSIWRRILVVLGKISDI
jgi:hypothetical protein